MPRGALKLPLNIFPGGVREGQNPASIDAGFLLSSKNWLTRDGVGRPRDGYSLHGAQLSSADRVIGFGFRGSPGVTTNHVTHTLSKAFSWNGASYSDITGTWTTTTAGLLTRFASFISGGTLWLLRVNEDNAVDKWDGTGSFVSPTGTAPKGRDITATNGRLLVTRADGNVFRYQWSDFNDVDGWTSGSFADLSETPDEAVAGRAFGPLSAACYKEDSVWLASAQVAKQPFQFQLIAWVPGPVSASAVVPYRGSHFWLGKDGVIYRFDGTRIEPVGTDLRTKIRDNWEWSFRSRVHGFILARAEPELWFIVPRVNTDKNDLGFSMNLVTGAMNSHDFAHSLTASTEWIMQPSVSWNSLTGTWDSLVDTYPTWNSMASGAKPSALLGDDVGNVSQFGLNTSDRGTAIAWEFVHPWRALGGIDKDIYLDGIASYWKKAATSLVVTVGVTLTKSLGDADAESTSTFNLTTDSNHMATFPDKRGKWIKVRHAGTGVAADVEHRGAAALAWPRGMA